MFRIFFLLIIFFNSFIFSFGEVSNNKKIFRFCEETGKIIKFKYCGVETPFRRDNVNKKIALDIKSEDILPGDGIKYFKIEQDGENEVLKIIANKEDPILLINNLNLNSFYYYTLVIEAKFVPSHREQIFGRVFWKSNLDQKYSIRHSTPFDNEVLNYYQKIKIDLRNRNYLGQIKKLVIHPLFDINHRNGINKADVEIEDYGIEAINENQALCNKQLEEEIVIYIKSIEFIGGERNLFNFVDEVNFEGHDFKALYLPPLSEITYNFEVPENNPVLLFSVFTPEWSYGVDMNVFIEDGKIRNLYNFKQRGFQYEECSDLIEVDMSQYAGKKINLTFSISSLTNQDRIFLKNPLIVEKRKKEIPNIILVLSDALRADHLSCYGYYRSTTPRLDNLAGNGVVFSNNISQAPSTKASHASLFTGKLPLELGIDEGNNSGKLKEQALTLAEILKDEGYLTFGLYANPYLRKEEGFSQGFDDYFYYCHGLEKTGWGGVKNSPEIGTKEAINLISQFKDFPFFLFLYYIDPHSPLNPPERANIFLDPTKYKEPFYYPRQADLKKYADEDYPKFTEQDYKILIDLYDGEIFNLDKNFDNFIDMLKRLNLFESAIIVFTADHGEALGERGGVVGHGRYHHYEQCHVPLLISYPNKIKKGEKYDKITGNIDVVPTLLTLLGKNYTKQDFEGLPLFTKRGELNHFNERHIHVETSDVGIHSVYNDDYLLIYNIQRNDGMLFNYKENKENISDLKEKKAEVYNNMVEKILEKIEKRKGKQLLKK